MPSQTRKIYLDHSATTPVDKKVLEAMLPYFNEKFGNASSIHAFGRETKVALEQARENIARTLSAQPSEIFFTSGGTESDNLAIKGIAFSLKDKGTHIITSKIEHHAVLHTCTYLEKQGFQVTYLSPDQFGMISPESVAAAITDKTILISIMQANNEVGTINPLHKIARVAKEKQVVFHSDIVQSYGKVPIDITELPVDLLSFSGHKIYGPKGTGGLFIRKGLKVDRLFHGGGHEKNMRAGTENIPGIIGLAKAAELAQSRMADDLQHISALRDHLYTRIMEKIQKVHLNGHPTERLAGLLNLSFEGIEGESLLLSLDLKGVAVSSGSACTSGSVEPSHVLLGMKVKPELAQSTIRFSLGRENTVAEIDYVTEILPEIIQRLRSISPIA